MKEYDELFLSRLLRLVGDWSRDSFSCTKEEVRNRYLAMYPPNFFQKKIGLLMSQAQIDRGIAVLEERELVHKEVTRFTDRPLKYDVSVYSLTEKGRKSVSGTRKR